MTRRKTAPKPKAPPITPELREAAKTLLLAQAYRKLTEPDVLAYQIRILEEHRFTADPANLHREMESFVVMDPDEAYLLSDEDSAVIFAEWEVAAREAGYKMDRGQCPLLVAKTMEIDAEHLFFDASKYLHHIEQEPWRPDIRRQLLDLTMDFVLASTGLTGQELMAGLKVSSFTYP